MTHQFMDKWVNKQDRRKALVRYEIRKLEARLRLLVEKNDHQAVSEELVSLCNLLAEYYNTLLEINGGEQEKYCAKEPLPYSLNATLEQIKDCNSQLRAFFSFQHEQELLQRTKQLYQHLVSLCMQHIAAKPAHNGSPNPLKSIIRASSPKEWLDAMVLFANERAGINAQDFLCHFSRLNKQELLNMAVVFSRSSYVSLTHAVFFYKMHPQALFQTELHPEKLISIRSRLTLLYDFIETVHHTLAHVLMQQGLPSLQDYLFHNEELPNGVQIQIDEAQRVLVLSAIKSSKFNGSLIEQTPGLNHLQDVFRAYKYWFNPARLMDAVMNLQQQSMQRETTGKEPFYEAVCKAYAQLTTTECLDLYGYYSNKDTNYLMRTLLTIMHSNHLSWLPKLSASEKKAIQTVYQALESTMNALRSELDARRIHTHPYQREVKQKNIKPGRRIRQAVHRALKLYNKEDLPRSERIDELLKEME